MNSFYKPFVTLSSLFIFSYSILAQSTSYSDECPETLDIIPLESCGDYQFKLGDGQPNEDVYWYFDDGTYQDHVSHTTNHHYANAGSYAGYAQYTSDLCPTTTYNFFLIVPQCNSTSISIQENRLNEILIYPNPTTNYLFIENKAENKCISIQICNHLGQIVYASEEFFQKSIKINTTDFYPGFYHLTLIYKNDVQSFRFSIVK